MTPSVTVLIINHNYGTYLPQAVESVLRQDIAASEFEVLVIDDSSTDDSNQRIKPYLDRIRCIVKPQGGQVSAFNLGFSQSKGEYVALLESDDTWEPSKLRRCLERLNQEPETALVQHWLMQTDAQNQPLPGYFYPSGPAHFGLLETLYGTIPFAGTSCIVFRASKLRSYLPIPEELLFGADICLRLIAATLGPIANIPETLGRRRIHGRNLFGRTLYDDPEKLERALVFHDAMAEYQRSHLAGMGIAVDPAYFKHLQIERIQMEFFAKRYRSDFIGAARVGARLLRLSGLRPYTAFKALTLSAAFVSPKFHLWLHEMYARNRLAKNLRACLFPTHTRPA